MKILLITCTLFCLVMQPVYGKDLNDAYAVFGVGGKTCRTFNQAMRLGGRPYQEYQSWLLGYFSAYNQYMPNTYNILGAKRMDQIILWLDDYCKQNPQQFFVTASAILLKKIHSTRRNLSPAADETKIINTN